ncbi:MAG: PAS domain S-box protein, partial [Acidimicrobiia bacterium]|nr:PAS domain S-box protein [Acidimicrobiia bacterium]
RGSELEADVIVTATGFDLSVLGDIPFTVDGAPFDLAQTVTPWGIVKEACHTADHGRGAHRDLRGAIVGCPSTARARSGRSAGGHSEEESRMEQQRSEATPLPASLAHALIESSPDGVVVVDRAGMIRLANPKIAEMFGYQSGELEGQSVECLLPLADRRVHTAHRLRYMAAPCSRPMGEDLELWGRRSDGAEFPLEIALSPVAAGEEQLVIATVRDVTSRRLAQQQLRNVSELLAGLGEAVFFADADDMSIGYANRAACRLTGYDHDELMAMTPRHLLPSWDRDRAAKLLADLRERPVTCTTELRRKDGIDLMVECDVSLPTPIRGEATQVVAVVRDISTRLAQLAQQQAVAELTALVGDRERIARDLHDTAIQDLFGAGLALQSIAFLAGPDLQPRLMEIVERQDEVIRQIRTAIFGLTAKRNGDSLTDQVQAVLDESVRILGFRPSLVLSGLVDTMATPAVISQAVPALREALSNVARHARASQVTVDLTCADGSVTLRVADNGIGLVGRPGDGAGHGLVNLRERAVDLGGSFEIAPAPEGTGTTLVWTVPVAP